MNTIQKQVEDVVEDGMMNYSAYVLLDRALSDIRDGLKPVHRRILYTMLVEKATKLTKSANISGAVMKYHPHGDSYPTMVNMVQTDKQNIPLIIGKGNFAQHTSKDMAPGASRYTEVKLSEVALDMLSNLDKGLVDFIPNYDGTLKMPEVLPVKFPVILTQANIGIGVGFGSAIPPFNIRELNEAIIVYINTGKKTMLVPDFATYGFIANDEEAFKSINETGSGSIKLRGKATITKNEIAITEIPYTTNREAIIDKIIELSKAGKLKEVVSVKDLTGLKGQLIEVVCRKNADMEMVLNKLYKLTPLESSFSANMNMLVDNLPRVAGVWETVDIWLKWRKECIVRGLQYDIEKMKQQLHLLRGLEQVLLDIDRAIEIIRKAPEEIMIPSLQSAFGIDEIQAKEVANMKLKNINENYIVKKINEVQTLENKISTFQKILKSNESLNKIICNGLQESADKYGHDRKTQIVDMQEIGKIVFEDPKSSDYEVSIVTTKEGYVYKTKLGKQVDCELKAGDEITKMFTSVNSAELLVFTKNGDCHKVKLSDIPETKANSFGAYLPTIIDAINIINYSVLDNKNKFIINVFHNKKVAKVDLKSFVGNRKKLKNSLNTKSPLIDILTYDGEGAFHLVTDRFEMDLSTTDFTLTNTRSAMGAFATTRKGEVTSVKKL